MHCPRAKLLNFKDLSSSKACNSSHNPEELWILEAVAAKVKEFRRCLSRVLQKLMPEEGPGGKIFLKLLIINVLPFVLGKPPLDPRNHFTPVILSEAVEKPALSLSQGPCTRLLAFSQRTLPPLVVCPLPARQPRAAQVSC